MEKLASRHAICELFNWISLMESVIDEDEENLKSAVGSSVIQDYLQKYKVVEHFLLIHDSFCLHVWSELLLNQRYNFWFEWFWFFCGLPLQVRFFLDKILLLLVLRAKILIFKHGVFLT